MSQEQPSASSISMSSFDAIIFDLGGVILPLHPKATIDELSTLFGRDASVVYTQAKQVDLFDRLERGEISPDDFRRQLCSSFDRQVDSASLDRAWNAMLGTLPQAHLEFLRRLQAQKRTFLLSNTNAIHVERFLGDFARDHSSAALFSDYFEAVHYSHLLRMRKPEPRIFRTLIERHALEPSRTIFLDDNRDNVEAGLSVGLRAVHHPTNSPLIERFVP